MSLTPRQKRTLGFILTVKVSLLLLVWLVAEFFPQFFNSDNYFNPYNFHWPLNQLPTTETWFMTWDSQIYFYLSQKGYPWGGSLLVAYFPLWPVLIRLFSVVFFGHYLITALVLSNALSLLGMVLLHDLLSQEDPDLADRSLLLLLFFPGSIFFMFPYTESLFLFLNVLFFRLLFKRRYAGTALVSFFLPLTRMLGIFSIVPALFQGFMDYRKKKPVGRSFILLGLAVPLGLLSYFGLMRFCTGDGFIVFKMQKYFIAFLSTSNFLNVGHFIKEYLTASWSHNYTQSWMDRFWFTVYALSLPAIWRYNKTLFSYALFLGFIPVLAGSFMSFTRYVSVIFPMFTVWARFFDAGKSRWVFTTLVLSFFGLQLYFLILHAANYWVG